jgi:hypothetical protein
MSSKACHPFNSDALDGWNERGKTAISAIWNMIPKPRTVALTPRSTALLGIRVKGKPKAAGDHR